MSVAVTARWIVSRYSQAAASSAIRTALLNQVNDGARREPDENNRKLQQRLFDYSMGDLHKDPMRLVSVGDAHWSGKDNVPGNEIRFAVNRQRKLKQGQRLQQSMAEEKGLYQILECISSLQPRCLTTTLNISKPQSSLANRPADKLPNNEYLWSARDIAKACNNFYQKLFEQEIKAMRTMDYLDKDWQAVIQEAETQQQAAGYLKVRMQQEKCWKENSAKKNPAKDKAYQRTLIVKGYL